MKNIHTITGSNVFQAKAQLKSMISDFTKEHTDMALEKIDATEVSADQLINAVEAQPFLCDKKMVIIYDLSTNKQAAEMVERIIERTNDSTELIFSETKIDKRGTLYKILKKTTSFQEFNEVDEYSLSNWLLAQAKEKGATLSKSDATYLIQRVGTSQQRLSKELEKLIQYNPQVSKSSIELLTDENPSSTIFNLVDSVFAGNTAQALKLYEDQRKQRVEPQAIHGMLVWQMHAVSIAAAAPYDKSAADIAKDSGLSPYVVQKSQRIARQMGRQRIAEFIQLLRDIDYKGKHQTFNYDEAMKFAIVSLAY